MATVINDMDMLVEPFRSIALDWEDFCRRLIDDYGHGRVYIRETLRTAERQAECVARGVSSVAHSKHQDGLALDFSIMDEQNREVTDGADWRYTLCGYVGKAMGMKWPTHLANGALDAGHLELPSVIPHPVAA